MYVPDLANYVSRDIWNAICLLQIHCFMWHVNWLISFFLTQGWPISLSQVRVSFHGFSKTITIFASTMLTPPIRAIHAKQSACSNLLHSYFQTFLSGFIYCPFCVFFLRAIKWRECWDSIINHNRLERNTTKHMMNY
jgi:hypothetical protein